MVKNFTVSETLLTTSFFLQDLDYERHSNHALHSVTHH